MLAREISADHIYLACGYTDMRKSIDGLAGIVSSHFKMDPHQPALFLFVADARIASRHCCGTRLVFFCCISGWKMAGISGPISQQIYWNFPVSSFVGLPKDYLSPSLARSGECSLLVPVNVPMCITIKICG